MPALTMPATPGIRSVRFGLRANTRSFVSPLNRAVQTFELPGAVWFATFELPPMTRDQAAEWQAFIAGLMGQAGRFYGFDPDATTPRGIYSSGSDTPLVAGAGQGGATLATDGWRVSGTGLLLPGDYFAVAGELKMATAQLDSDGAGAATIAFKPPLRTSPADDAALTITNPKAVMMLADDSQAVWQSDANRIVQGFAFSGVEAF